MNARAAQGSGYRAGRWLISCHFTRAHLGMKSYSVVPMEAMRPKDPCGARLVEHHLFMDLVLWVSNWICALFVAGVTWTVKRSGHFWVQGAPGRGPLQRIWPLQTS